MRNVAQAALGTMAVLALAVTGVIGWSAWQGGAAAQGPWQAVAVPYLCSELCSIVVDADGTASGAPEAGDPVGRQDALINVIAKIEADGCEWQWQPNAFTDAEGTAFYNYNVLFRC